ncbi:MAG: glycosyltransferase [Bacteroidales bacterium]|nr:glycosyltransferase [Bacteroidales bacterium]
MKFSVIVPVYNASDTIARCVDSIIASGLPNEDLEIILVNDGSVDGSGDLCESIAADHPFIKVIHKENEGVSVARNVGISVAAGEFICFCDSDDRFTPGGFRSVIPYCDESIDLIRFYCDIIFNENNLDLDQSEARVTFQGSGKEYLRRFGIETFCWNYLYRREFLVSKGLLFTPGILAEDIDFIFRVMMADPKIKSLSDHVYQYSIRPNSISTDRSPENSRRFATDFASTLIKISSSLKEFKDTDPVLYHSCRESLDARVITLFSRVLSSNYSGEEFNSFLISLKTAGLLPFESVPSSTRERISRAEISLLSHFPGVFPPSRWIFRHLFLPVIYPGILREINRA